MPTTVFYILLNMSVSASLIIAALLLIRKIRRLPRRMVYALWGVALLRLSLPVSPGSPLSLFHYASGLVKRLVPAQNLVPDAASAPWAQGFTMMNALGLAESYAPVRLPDGAVSRVFTAGAWVWLAVAPALLLTVVILYRLTRAQLKTAVRLRGSLYTSDALLSPMLLGLFRPKILLPAGLDADSAEGRLVIAHETVHRRRLDNVWRLAAVVIACVHWFNPLVWLMLKCFLTDMELSCDEAVVRRLGDEERRAYTSALLRFAEDRRFVLSAAFGRSGVKTRIVHVLRYKRLTLTGAAASAVFLLALAAALLTNPS